jgi:hypothetical protein
MKKALIYIFGFIFAIAMSYGIAHAETTASLTFESAGAGYDSGIGARLEHTQRWGWFGLHGVGRYALQHKTGADSGYTYGISGSLRGYWRDFYVAAGYGLSGYRSEFANGAVWGKRGWQPHVGVGYDSDRFDVGLSYSFKESDTPNEVSAIKLGTSWQPTESGLALLFELTRMEFNQGERRNDVFVTFGVGWRF